MTPSLFLFWCNIIIHSSTPLANGIGKDGNIRLLTIGGCHCCWSNQCASTVAFHNLPMFEISDIYRHMWLMIDLFNNVYYFVLRLSIAFMLRRLRWQKRVRKFRPMVRDYEIWAGRDFYHGRLLDTGPRFLRSHPGIVGKCVLRNNS